MNKDFLGRGWAFPPTFTPGARQADMISHEDDIRQSLLILLSTAPGERVMQPTFGCGIKSMVFDSIDETAMTQICDIIERAILFFEHRIILDNIQVGTEREYQGVVDISIDYTIRATNHRSNMVYPFYFREGTDIKAL